ncbi:metal ABC transporter substrate-binding protein [soil metagenome]
MLIHASAIPWRRLSAAIVAVLLAAMTAACGATSRAETERLDVVTSMSVLAGFAENVAGEHAEVTSLVPVGGDPHVYEPVPSDSRRITDADVVLHNGLGLEPWFASLVAGSGREAVAVADALQTSAVDGDSPPDPHLWMVPPRAAAYVDVIADALAAADPEHADDYASNAESYKAELDELDADVAATLATIPPQSRTLVTSHDAYSYFAEHYGLEVVGTVVGFTTEEEPSAAAVSRLVDQIRAHGVPTIFVETTVNPDVIERIARDAGVAVGRPLYGDSLGEEGSGADTYAGMLRANAEALAEGLGG